MENGTKMQDMRTLWSTGKIVDQSERRIQAHKDQMAHMQHQTDIPEVHARGIVIRGHMVAYHQGRPSGPGLQCLTPFAGSFVAAS